MMPRNLLKPARTIMSSSDDPSSSFVSRRNTTTTIGNVRLILDMVGNLLEEETDDTPSATGVAGRPPISNGTNSSPALSDLLPLHPRPINPARIQVVDKVQLSDTDWKFHDSHGSRTSGCTEEETPGLLLSTLLPLLGTSIETTSKMMPPPTTMNSATDSRSNTLPLPTSTNGKRKAAGTRSTQNGDDDKVVRSNKRLRNKTYDNKNDDVSGIPAVKNPNNAFLSSSSSSSFSPPPPPPSSSNLLDGSSSCWGDGDGGGSSSSSSGDGRFRIYQSEQWFERYQEFVTFVQHHGHARVPHILPNQQGLAQWVKRQRYQYKLFKRGVRSTLTTERIQLLNDMNFVWDIHQVAWEEHMNELCTYYRNHGHCNVPSSSNRSTTTASNDEYSHLSVWIKTQRRQYRLYQQGKRSTMTQERVKRFEQLGIIWNPRGC